MTRFRLAVLLLIGAAFLAAPLSALCSSCCAAGENGLSAPMPCCDGTCGPSFTAARPREPAMTSPKAHLDPPLLSAVLQSQAIERPSFTGSRPATSSASPTESPPVSTSVLRL